MTIAVKKKGSMQRGKIQVRKNQQFRNTEPGCVYPASLQVGYQKPSGFCVVIVVVLNVFILL